MLTLNFADESVTELVAGTPYIIKWADGDNLVNPVFEAVTINSNTNDFISTDGKVQFKGTYRLLGFNAENKNILFLGDNNTLYYPEDGATIGAQHAYFQLVEGADVKSFVLNFGDGNETGIRLTDYSQSAFQNGAGVWYDMFGRKVINPVQRGIYMNNGRKVVIK